MEINGVEHNFLSYVSMALLNTKAGQLIDTAILDKDGIYKISDFFKAGKELNGSNYLIVYLGGDFNFKLSIPTSEKELLVSIQLLDSFIKIYEEAKL